MAKLQVTYPDKRDESFDLEGDIITIGRLSDNIVRMDDGSVSSHHAQLTLDGKNYVLKDLNSTNGTRHNGVAVSTGNLSDGDSVRFGKVTGTYFSGESSHSQPLPETDGAVAKVADSSVKPSNFSNASPFTGKSKSKDSTGMAALGFAAVAILVFLFALLKVLMVSGA